ncbi:hypothetical protein UlMin_013333 [Ulmus minor]
MRKQTQRSRLVVLVPCPFQGHISPMLQLGDMLHSKGFSITIVHANFNSPNPQNHSHFTFFPTLSIQYIGAILWNTVDCLEHSILEQIQQQCQVPIFPIGPIHRLAPALVSSTSLIKEDRSCISWLDKQPHCSVIYVSSFGSLASLGEKEVAEIAWGLANSNQPFLWVIRPGSIRGSEWIELLPQGFQDAVGQRGFIVKWVPQKEVLAHEAVGGYLSHAWRVGLEFEELKRGEIERVVRKLLLEDEGKEMRKRAMEFKEKFEVSAGKVGSSYNSLNELVNFIMSL